MISNFIKVKIKREKTERNANANSLLQLYESANHRTNKHRETVSTENDEKLILELASLYFGSFSSAVAVEIEIFFFNFAICYL